MQKDPFADFAGDLNQRNKEISGFLLFGEIMIPVETKLGNQVWCRLAKEKDHAAYFQSEAIYLYDLRAYRGVQTLEAVEEAFKKSPPKRYPYLDIAAAALHPDGKVLYVLEDKGRLMKVELPEIGDKVNSTVLLENIAVSSLSFVCLNESGTQLLVFTSVLNCWSVFDLESNTVTLKKDEESQFTEDCEPVCFDFNAQCFKMVSKMNNTEFPSFTRTNWMYSAHENFNSIMSLGIKAMCDCESDSLKDLIAGNMIAMLKKMPSGFLLKNIGLFVMLAHLERQDLISVYIERTSFKSLFKKDEIDLIGWIFSTLKCGVMIRKLVMEWLDKFEQLSHENMDTFEPDIFERLIKYKYILKMMKEIFARGIFLKLMRIPVSEKEDLKRQWLVDKDEDVNDKTRHNIMYQERKENLGNKRKIEHFISGVELHDHLQEFKVGVEEIRGNDPVLLQPYISAAPLDMTFGSIHLTELILILQQITDEDLVTNFRPLIYQLWYKAVYPIAIVYMTFYWLFAIISYIFYGFYEKNYGLGGTSIFFSVLFMISEFLAFRSMGKTGYIKSVWNLVDLTILTGNIVLVILQWTVNVQTAGWAIARSLIIMAIWLRALTWLRVFKPVRYLITMVLQVFTDMIAYIVVLAGAIIGLTFVWRMSGYFSPPAYQFDEESDENRQVLTFFHSLQVVTGMMFGNIPDREPDDSFFSPFKFFVVCLMGLVLALALTNLLIAIINQTYTSIEEKKKVHDLREVMGLILEFNGQWSALPKSKNSDSKKFYVLSLGPKIEKEEKKDNQEVDEINAVLNSPRRSQ